jgi:biopolymer transport protein ExbB
MKSKLLIIAFSLFLPLAYSQEEKPDTALSLEELLELVQQGKFAESEEATQREQKFAKERSRQATLLANAKAERSRLEAIATELERRFEANDSKLVVL